MKIITNNDISYDNVKNLEKIFLSFGLNARLKDDLGIANDRVDIAFKSTDNEFDFNTEVVVMVWVSSGNHDILKYRSVIFNQKERDNIKAHSELWKNITGIAETTNQNTQAFGTLSLSNVSGIVVDYNLTIAGGILDSTLINSAIAVAQGAQATKMRILRAMKYLFNLNPDEFFDT